VQISSLKKPVMKSPTRSLLAVSVALLLTACGGADIQGAAPNQIAAVTQVAAVSSEATGAAQAPQPDCAPEACSGLRIIDGNAEAYRADALRRASAEANGDVVL
jgi:hypothetical protein